METLAIINNVACPTCKVDKGESCILTSSRIFKLGLVGKPKIPTTLHKRRRDLYEKSKSN